MRMMTLVDIEGTLFNVNPLNVSKFIGYVSNVHLCDLIMIHGSSTSVKGTLTGLTREWNRAVIEQDPK